VATSTTASVPGDATPEERVVRILRVDHAGEYGAKRIYDGQLAALAELDASFFRVRFDRLTPAQQRYMRAMAELGPGPHRSGDAAHVLGRRVTTVAPLRNSLIAKGMIFSPAHGDTAFTVPLFGAFMERIMSQL